MNERLPDGRSFVDEEGDIRHMADFRDDTYEELPDFERVTKEEASDFKGALAIRDTLNEW